MKDKLEKLNNLKDKIQARIDEVDDLLQSTLYDSLLDERLRLHRALDDVYADISILEYSNREPENRWL